MDWGSESPLRYTLSYVLAVGIFLALVFGVLALASGGDDLTGVGQFSMFTVGATMVGLFIPVYLLFYWVNSLVSSRLDKYHERVQDLPSPDSLANSDLTNLESIDDELAQTLWGHGYLSTEHLKHVDMRTLARDADIGQHHADEIKSELAQE